MFKLYSAEIVPYIPNVGYIILFAPPCDTKLSVPTIGCVAWSYARYRIIELHFVSMRMKHLTALAGPASFKSEDESY